MEEKKIKIEVSKVTLIFVILFGLCLLVWTFILGVWVGTKIGEKPREEVALNETAKEKVPVAQAPQVLPSENLKATNQTLNQIGNQTAALTNETAEIPKEPKEDIKEVKKEVKKEEKKEVKKEVKEKPKKAEAIKPSVSEEPKYTKKEVAKIASEIKSKETKAGGYFIQVGAFSHREKAISLADKAKKEGLPAEIKEEHTEGKTLFKVLIGGYESREIAEKKLEEVKKKLGIEKPFITKF